MAEYEEETKEKLLVRLENAGQLFPGYQLSRENGGLKLLGKGGFSSVYEMRKADAHGAEGESRAYALKVLGMERHTVSEERFRETCRLQRKLAEQTPYIMRLLDVRESPQMILMERVDPILEKDKFHNVRLLREDLEGEEGVLQFALQIGEAIRTAHENQVLHRDIKLENIFWNADEKVYQLGDFGIAKFVENGQAETVVYTDGYGAPEIERRLVDRYSAAADIYSFGITLYLLLNGLKFPGSDRYRANSVQYDPEFVFPAPAKASPQMAGVIRRMCSFYPEDRYRSMDEVLAEFGRLIRERGESAGQIVRDEETEDKVTVTYREPAEESAETLGLFQGVYHGVRQKKNSRMERLLRERMQERVYRQMEGWYTFVFSVLLLLFLYGMQEDTAYLTDWRFWSFPAAVLIEVILLKIKDFHVIFGIVTLALGVYSMTAAGITVSHVILLMGLLSGIPEVAAAGAIAVFGWLFLRLAGGVGLMDFLTGDWIVWIYPVILLPGMHNWVWIQLFRERKENVGWRGTVWEAAYYLLPYISVAAGLVLEGAMKIGILTVPMVIDRLNPISAGLALFIVQCVEEIKERNDCLDEERD